MRLSSLFILLIISSLFTQAFSQKGKIISVTFYEECTADEDHFKITKNKIKHRRQVVASLGPSNKSARILVSLDSVLKKYKKTIYLEEEELEPEDGEEPKTRTVIELVNSRTNSEKVTLNLEFDKLLLTDESETVKVESGFCDRSSVPRTYTKNEHYSFSKRTRWDQIELKGNRKQVRFPTTSFSFTIDQVKSLTLKDLFLNNDNAVILKDLEANGGKALVAGNVRCLSKKRGGLKGRSKEDKAKDKASKQEISQFKLDLSNNGNYQTGIFTGCDFKVIVYLKLSLYNSSYYKQSFAYKRVVKQFE